MNLTRRFTRPYDIVYYRQYQQRRETVGERRASQREAQKRYQKKLKTYILRFRIDQDADVIARMEQVGSKTGFIRELVRRDIRGE